MAKLTNEQLGQYVAIECRKGGRDDYAAGRPYGYGDDVWEPNSDALRHWREGWIAAAEEAQAKAAAYRRQNPLGGPAVIFEAMAERVQAGDEFYDVLKDFGYLTVEAHMEALGKQIAEVARLKARLAELETADDCLKELEEPEDEPEN